MDLQLLSRACHLYQTSPDELVSLSGGYYNAVYQFPLQKSSQVFDTIEVPKTGEAKKYGVLRIGVEDCPAEQTLGMLEWVRFLSDQGAPVTAPIYSSNGFLLERLEQDGKAYTITAFEAAEGTLAERIPPGEWTDALFSSIGMAVGKLHAVSKHYRPSAAALTRPQWHDSYEIREATERLAGTADPARENLAVMINEVKLLPTEPSDFGLIHDDLHFANFLIQPHGKVMVIDFDDCVYGWFVVDVAMALFDILVLYPAGSEEQRRSFAERFMHHYLAGYRQENELSTFWLAQIPRFLKLKELCIYADLIGHPESDHPGTWVGEFMRGRAERIARDIPYVDIDFTRLSDT